MNLLQVSKTFATEDQALDYLVNARWPDGVRCLACGHDKVYRIDTTGKTGKPCRLYECAECGLHFSATTGTLFHDSHLPLTKWFATMALMAEAKKGISANQVSRHIGVTYKTAWYLCHRIRNAMSESTPPKLGGPGKIVEVDESFVGGKKRGKDMKARQHSKVKVLGIAERGGRIHLQTIPNFQVATLAPLLKENIDPATQTVVVDGANRYVNMDIPGEQRQRGNHAKELAEFGFITSARSVETAFSLFKRGLVGSFHKMSRDHMDSYLQEFCWRFNRRHMQEHMFDLSLHNLTERKPLPYKKLTREIF